jgi:hypothetical protein
LTQTCHVGEIAISNYSPFVFGFQDVSNIILQLQCPVSQPRFTPTTGHHFQVYPGFYPTVKLSPETHRHSLPHCCTARRTAQTAMCLVAKCSHVGWLVRSTTSKLIFPISDGSPLFHITDVKKIDCEKMAGRNWLMIGFGSEQYSSTSSEQLRILEEVVFDPGFCCHIATKSSNCGRRARTLVG